MSTCIHIDSFLSYTDIDKKENILTLIKKKKINKYSIFSQNRTISVTVVRYFILSLFPLSTVLLVILYYQNALSKIRDYKKLV